MKILISGGSGLIGRKLTSLLQQNGHEVAWLSRSINLKTDIPVYLCDYLSGNIDKQALQTADAIIHLAGANIGSNRWTKKRQSVIYDSRVKTARLIFDNIKNTHSKLKVYISASAVGFYGAINSSEIFNETKTVGSDFLAKVCQNWENEADAFCSIGVRVAKIRTGVVLSLSGAALKKIITSFKFGVKVTLGSGRQYLPWIHINDLCNIYLKAVEDKKMLGTYNAVAPEHKTYAQFSTQLEQYFEHIWIRIKVPAFFLRLILGKMALILLKGTKVDSSKIVSFGFQFKYPTLKQALKDICKN